MRLVFRLVLLSSVCAFYGLLAQGAQAFATRPTENYLGPPPFYLNNEYDFPLSQMDVIVPKTGHTLASFDLSRVSADHWKQDGNAVQPGLDLEINWLRMSVLHGLGDGWAAGISIPWYRNQTFGTIGGQPAPGITEGFGNIDLICKKRLWTKKSGERATVAAALELPTGKDNGVFAQSNFVTNAYYRNYPARMPLGWEPSTGTFNGLLAASYGKYHKRFSYEGVLAGKIYGTNDEDVKVGNLFLAAITSTYGVTSRLGASLGFTLRSQADDSYPLASAPGVEQPALAGTTTHGSFLYLDFALRYRIHPQLIIGVGVRSTIVDPSSGMAPSTIWSIIASPSF